MNIIIIDKESSFTTTLSQYISNCGEFHVLKTFTSFNDVSNFMDNKRNIYELAILDLELPNLNLDKFIVNLPKGCKIIATTSFKEKIIDLINYPYFQKIFLKPIPFSNFLTYISVQNGIETYENVKKFMIQSLSQLGFNLNHAGTSYIIEGTILAMRSNIKKLSDIYTLLGYKCSEDPKIINWSVNNAINKAIKVCDEKNIQNFFKIYDKR